MCGWRATQRTHRWPLVTLHCLLHPSTLCHFQTFIVARSMSPFISPNSQQLPVFVILELPARSTASKGSSQVPETIGKSLLLSHGVGHALPSIYRVLWTRSVGRERGPTPHPASAARLSWEAPGAPRFDPSMSSNWDFSDECSCPGTHSPWQLLRPWV